VSVDGFVCNCLSLCMHSTPGMYSVAENNVQKLSISLIHYDISAALRLAEARCCNTRACGFFFGGGSATGESGKFFVL